MKNTSYLWDKSEPVDAFVAKLERLLAPRRVEIMKRAARPRGLRILRVVGSMAIAAAAAVLAWVCCMAGGDVATAAPGADRAAPPPVAVETAPEGVSPDRHAARGAMTEGANKGTEAGLEGALGDPASEPATAATTQ